MPTVPGERVHDPFNTKNKDKDQLRPPSFSPPPDEYLLVAAAQMRDLGRLYSPPAPTLGFNPILQSAWDDYHSDEPKAP